MDYYGAGLLVLPLLRWSWRCSHRPPLRHTGLTALLWQLPRPAPSALAALPHQCPARFRVLCIVCIPLRFCSLLSARCLGPQITMLKQCFVFRNLKISYLLFLFSNILFLFCNLLDLSSYLLFQFNNFPPSSTDLVFGQLNPSITAGPQLY